MTKQIKRFADAEYIGQFYPMHQSSYTNSARHFYRLANGDVFFPHSTATKGEFRKQFTQSEFKAKWRPVPADKLFNKFLTPAIAAQNGIEFVGEIRVHVAVGHPSTIVRAFYKDEQGLFFVNMKTFERRRFTPEQLEEIRHNPRKKGDGGKSVEAVILSTVTHEWVAKQMAKHNIPSIRQLTMQMGDGASKRLKLDGGNPIGNGVKKKLYWFFKALEAG